MHRDSTRIAHPIVIVALVMLIAAGSAITAAAGSGPEDFVGEYRGEAQAFPAALSIQPASGSEGVFTGQMLPWGQDETDMARARRRSGVSPSAELRPAPQAAAGAGPPGRPA